MGWSRKENSIMKKLFLVTLVLLMLSLGSFAQKTTVYFEKSSFELSVVTQQVLSALADDLKEGNGMEEVALIGHTDVDADELYNKELSLLRARAVADYFYSRGVVNRLHLESHGESELINENRSEEEKQENRRVEILRHYNTDNIIFTAMQETAQEFRVRSNADTVLTGKKGSKIYLKANTFTVANDQAKVLIKIREYYSKADMILANLTTRTLDGKLLDSKGVLHVSAFDDSVKIEPATGKTMGFYFKNKRIGDASELFGGIQSTAQMRWKRVTKSGTLADERGFIFTLNSNDTVRSQRWWYEELHGKYLRIERMNTKGVISFDSSRVEEEKIRKALIISASKQGWLSCNSAVEEQKSTADLMVEYSGDFVPEITVVYPNGTTLVNYSYREDNKVIFRNLPIGAKVELVALYKNSKMNAVKFAHRSIVVGSDTKVWMSLKAVDMAEVKKEVGKI